MSEIKNNLRYTKDHEWADKLDEPKKIRIGITDFAQSSLGDVTYVDLPQIDDTVNKGDSIGSIESVKAVSDIYAPVSGKIIAINGSLNDDPSGINNDPFGTGWLLEIEMDNEEDWNSLLSAQAYEQHAQ